MLKNLRNMVNADVGADAIRQGLKNVKTDRVLPFEFITAARYAKQFEPQLEELMFKCLSGENKLRGNTTLLLDKSGSMNEALSAKSELKRYDAAAGLAMLLREECENVRVFTFTTGNPVEVAPRRGFALRDALGSAQGGTTVGQAVDWCNKNVPQDRIIVLTDEQSSDQVGGPKGKGYLVNIATYDKTVGTHAGWIRVAGWSEQVVEFIKHLESEDRIKN
jgi:60 kDa SS-A/Ro ribonucleoprotein